MVREGYKKTEVGLIPEDWEVFQVGELSEVKRGAGSQSITYVRTGGVRFIRINDFFEDSPVYVKDTDEIKRFTLTARDILFAGTGNTAGASFIPKNEWIGLPHSYNAPRIRVNDKCVKQYLLFSLQSENVLNQQKACFVGAAQPFLDIRAISRFKVTVPPLKEQAAIAEALSGVDGLIDGLEKLIAKKRDIKTATMQQLLTGKTRLPGFGEGKGYKQTELGEIPEDWSVAGIGDYIDLLTGYPFPSSQYSDFGIRLLRGSNIKRGVTDWNDDIVQFWPDVTTDISKYELAEGDIVIAMDGSLVGRSFAQLSGTDLPAILLQRVARIRTTYFDLGYLKEWICSEIFTAHCDKVKTVTAIPHISPEDIRTFKVACPPTKAEQKAIATLLSDMLKELEVIHVRLNKTKSIKQGMMQELLTGKTRLI